ncbi:MAG: hypothetical protein R6X34_05045 [Chloroflexota bacterium]
MKALEGERRRLVEVVGNHEMLGKNGRLRWHNNMKGNGRLAVAGLA